MNKIPGNDEPFCLFDAGQKQEASIAKSNLSSRRLLRIKEAQIGRAHV